MADTRQPIVRRIFEAAEKNPAKDALVYGATRIPYGALAGKILAAKAALEAQGVKRGDRVILSVSNSPSFTYGYFACHLMGAVALPVDPQINAAHLEYIIRQTEPAISFVPVPQGVSCRFQPIDSLDGTAPSGAAPASAITLEDTADVIFTTGTTGRPKGVVLTHRNILAAATNINEFIGNTAEDREVVPLPLSHSFGLGRLKCNMLLGGTVIVASQGFLAPEQIYSAIESNQATGFCCVPAGLALLFHLTGDKLGNYASQLKYVEIGSASMPYEHKKRLMRLLPKTRLCMHYGLTEASRSSFIEFHGSKSKLQSVGKPSPNVELRVVDKDLKDVPAKEPGQIIVRAETVMKEYWKDPAKTKEVLADGWLLTGDVAYKDEEGFIFIQGRADEMINVGGLKVSPIEIEEILKTHPGVKDCACVGVSDPRGLSGQLVKAYVVGAAPQGRPSPDELTTFLSAKLEPYKIPTIYEWTETIPKTASGKLQRKLLGTKG